ncbi:MAG: endonuclease [Mesorhizobium sp.]|uniref:endonuclease III domain-containing protein n=1 Tax=Mesorhizobium sp. TaxID=1871066 RepID=UPI001AD47AD4|nr:endonuclease [Mesorhizobium sp.]MBN9222150.1 endonuclease [Mesorhizobium sp.]
MGVAIVLYLFHFGVMQLTMRIGMDADLLYIVERLRQRFPPLPPFPRLDPISQLVKSLISSRTKDEVSWPTFWKLVGLYPQWRQMMEAPVSDIERAIAQVTFAEDKAANLLLTLRGVAKEHPDFDLTFLGDMTVSDAHKWLQGLDGVAVKVAASTLNFSTLNRPSFVIDSHVLRVLQRYGLVSHAADSDKAYRAVMGAIPDWSAEQLIELHRLVKKLGQSWCQKWDVRCDECPLAERCVRRI